MQKLCISSKQRHPPSTVRSHGHDNTVRPTKDNKPTTKKDTSARTGNKIKLKSFQIWRIADRKIVARESQVWDFIDFFKQIGVIEYTEKGKKLFPEK